MKNVCVIFKVGKNLRVIKDNREMVSIDRSPCSV